MQKYSKTKTALHSISTAATPPATPEKAGAASSFFGGLFGGSPTTTAAAGTLTISDDKFNSQDVAMCTFFVQFSNASLMHSLSR